MNSKQQLNKQQKDSSNFKYYNSFKSHFQPKSSSIHLKAFLTLYNKRLRSLKIQKEFEKTAYLMEQHQVKPSSKAFKPNKCKNHLKKSFFNKQNTEQMHPAKINFTQPFHQQQQQMFQQKQQQCKQYTNPQKIQKNIQNQTSFNTSINLFTPYTPFYSKSIHQPYQIQRIHANQKRQGKYHNYKNQTQYPCSQSLPLNSHVKLINQPFLDYNNNTSMTNKSQINTQKFQNKNKIQYNKKSIKPQTKQEKPFFSTFYISQKNHNLKPNFMYNLDLYRKKPQTSSPKRKHNKTNKNLQKDNIFIQNSLQEYSRNQSLSYFQYKQQKLLKKTQNLRNTQQTVSNRNNKKMSAGNIKNRKYRIQ